MGTLSISSSGSDNTNTRTDILKQCVFCDKEATDFIRLDDLDPVIMQLVPENSLLRKAFVSIALCQKHFWRYITHPQLERSQGKKKEKKRNDRAGLRRS